HQVDLAYAPGCLQPLYRYREVFTHRPTLLHQSPVGQLMAEGGAQQPLLVERLEILAVDPGQIDGAACRLACLSVGQQLADALGYVIHFHLHQLDLILTLELLPRPHQIGVDLRAAAPGVEVDSLALRLIKGLLPTGSLVGSVIGKECAACQQGQGAQQGFKQRQGLEHGRYLGQRVRRRGASGDNGPAGPAPEWADGPVSIHRPRTCSPPSGWDRRGWWRVSCQAPAGGAWRARIRRAAHRRECPLWWR